jgi:hypothetical protein
MSRYLVPVLILACAATGCVSPRDRFDEFGARVIDATLADRPEGAFADITGEFLVGVATTLDPSLPLLFLATIDVEIDNGTGTGTGQFEFQPLEASRCPGNDGLVPVGDPFAIPDVEIEEDGGFQAGFTGMLPGEANNVSCSTVRVEITFDAVIRSTEVWCGLIMGRVVTTNTSINGSTFGAIRIEPGTLGDDLPDPLLQCPVPEEPDAGVPDAGMADAGADAS